jgi:hypothetical protein
MALTRSVPVLVNRGHRNLAVPHIHGRVVLVVEQHVARMELGDRQVTEHLPATSPEIGAHVMRSDGTYAFPDVVAVE